MDIEKVGPLEEVGHKKKHRWAFHGNILKFKQDPIVVDVDRIQSKLKYKYILVFFLALCIILSSISVAGCSNSSSSSANNFLLQMRYAPFEMTRPTGDGIVNTDAYTTWNNNVGNNTDLQVRISYFGTCTRSSIQTSTTDYGDWFCTTNVTRLTSVLTVPTQDPFNMIYLMNNIRTNHVNPAILIASIAFNFIALVFLLRASLKRPNLYFISTGLTVFACTLGLLGMVWQQAAVDTAVSVARNLSNNSIAAGSGRVPAGLGWTSLLILFLTAIGIVALVLSEKQALQLYSDMNEEFSDSETVGRGGGALGLGAGLGPGMASHQRATLAEEFAEEAHHLGHHHHPAALDPRESLSIPGNMHTRVPYPEDGHTGGIPRAY